jgi:hypothetical protein
VLVKAVSLKAGMPTVAEALSHLVREIAIARQQGDPVVKLIHGYGSTGVGGEIRIAVQARLRAMAGRGEIQACIFGEDWSKSDAKAWSLLRSYPSLKADPHLGRKNMGITIVVL